jgi:hypothetical protein
MKNSIKWLGIIALIAVIGFSFVACGDAEQGPTGPKGDPGTNGTNGQKGDKGDTGSEGPMRPDILLTYIPAESGLLGTVWNRNSGSGTVTIYENGYTMRWYISVEEPLQVASYGKRPDGSHVINCKSNTQENYYLFIITDNTLTFYGSSVTTYTKQE